MFSLFTEKNPDGVQYIEKKNEIKDDKEENDNLVGVIGA